jgi:16S rRNA G966 N2-methylase RsmD
MCYYTPSEIIELARSVLGDIDPASSEIANRTVKAGEYFTKKDDGLSKEWFDRVWMNPPYAQPLIQKFSVKVCQ